MLKLERFLVITELGVDRSIKDKKRGNKII